MRVNEWPVAPTDTQASEEAIQTERLQVSGFSRRSTNSLSMRSLAVQLGQASCSATGGTVPPIHMAATFLRNPLGAEMGSRVYARSDNPNYPPVEQLLAALEGGAESMLFASGMAAAAAVVFALTPGDQILVPERFYAGIWEWLTKFVTSWGVSINFADFGDLSAVEKALAGKRHRLIWLETPTTPGLDIVSIDAFSHLAHLYGSMLLVDNTAATPILTKPLSRGADIVLHSATKALNGHDDIIAGALVTAKTDAFWDRVRMVRNKNGGIPGSLEAWLLGRGMRTLHHRVHAACSSALEIAERLAASKHQAILELSYPGLPEHPGHLIARDQMSGQFGNMISLRLTGGEDVALRLMTEVHLWRPGTSFGGVQSMLEHRASVDADYPPTPRDLVRLSVGLEDPDDLFQDLCDALDAAHRSLDTVSIHRPLDPKELYTDLIAVIAPGPEDCILLLGKEATEDNSKPIEILFVTSDFLAEQYCGNSFWGQSVETVVYTLVVGDNYYRVTMTTLTFVTSLLSAICERDVQASGAPQQSKSRTGSISDAAGDLIDQMISGCPIIDSDSHRRFLARLPFKSYMRSRYQRLVIQGRQKCAHAEAQAAQGDILAAISTVRSAATSFVRGLLIKLGIHVISDREVESALRDAARLEAARMAHQALREIELSTEPKDLAFRRAIANCSAIEKLAEANAYLISDPAQEIADGRK